MFQLDGLHDSSSMVATNNFELVGIKHWKNFRKLLNADWSMKRAFFLNFACEEGKITGSRLVLRLLSNSLCYREVVAKKFSVTMTSRFEIADEEYIEELKEARKSKHEEKHGVLEERFQKVGQ